MILKMMQTAVQSGTGQEASLNKYTVSGKTGTVRLNKNGRTVDPIIMLYLLVLLHRVIQNMLQQ